MKTTKTGGMVLGSLEEQSHIVDICGGEAVYSNAGTGDTGTEHGRPEPAGYVNSYRWEDTATAIYGNGYLTRDILKSTKSFVMDSFRKDLSPLCLELERFNNQEKLVFAIADRSRYEVGPLQYVTAASVKMTATLHRFRLGRATRTN